MEIVKKMLPRRAVMSSILGAGAGAALTRPALALVPQYPQLTQPAIRLADPTRLYFVSGTVIGSRVFACGQQGAIVYSDDMGKTWQQAEVPVSATITDIAFATPKVGWATGALGVVLKTSDGGQSWVLQLDGLQEIKLMSKATQAYVAAQPAGSDAADRATRRADILTRQGPDKPMLSLLALSETEVFVFGAYRFADRSTDGGRSWTDWAMNIGDPLSHNLYGAAAIDGNYYLVAEEGLIFRSTDGGQSFPQLAQLGEPNPSTLFGVTANGAGGILVYGVAGAIYLSTDQGKSWTPCDFSGTSNINTIVTLDMGLTLAGDSGGALWYSTDHGKSFTLGTRNPIMAVNALLPLGPKGFVIVSSVGVFPVPDITKMKPS